jgi:hypothetical protein
MPADSRVVLYSVREFAEQMDAVMRAKRPERGGRLPSKHTPATNLFVPVDHHISKLVFLRTKKSKVKQKPDIPVSMSHLTDDSLGLVLKHSVHVANYMMLLYTLANSELSKRERQGLLTSNSDSSSGDEIE